MIFVVRKSLIEEEYLDGDGNWGAFPRAKQFGSEDAAEEFMTAHNASDSHILTYWRAKEMWELRMDFWCGEDELWSARPADRIFIVTPTRDSDLYRVCSTGDKDGELIFIYAQNDYEVVKRFSSMQEAAAYCSAEYGIDHAESM